MGGGNGAGIPAGAVQRVAKGSKINILNEKNSAHNDF